MLCSSGSGSGSSVNKTRVSATDDASPPPGHVCCMNSALPYFRPSLLLALVLLPAVLSVLPRVSSDNPLEHVGRSIHDHHPPTRSPQLLDVWNYTAAKVKIIARSTCANYDKL